MNQIKLLENEVTLDQNVRSFLLDEELQNQTFTYCANILYFIRSLSGFLVALNVWYSEHVMLINFLCTRIIARKSTNPAGTP